MHAGPDGRMGPPEPAQLPPMFQDLGRVLPRSRSPQFMNERRLASPSAPGTLKRPSQLVSVVDLGAAGRQEEAGPGAEGILAVRGRTASRRRGS